MNGVSIVETSEAKKNFYPTPEPLAARLLAGIDWYKIENVLEPSAGKGDLAAYVDRQMRSRYQRYRSMENEPQEIDCVEIDPNLRAILEAKKLRVVGGE